MRRNALWGSVGVVLAPWCAPIGLYLEDLAINQRQDWFVWISPAFFYFLFFNSRDPNPWLVLNLTSSPD